MKSILPSARDTAPHPRSFLLAVQGLLAALPVVLFLGGCQPAAVTVSQPIAHHLSTSPVSIKVRPDVVIRDVPKELFGTNLEWFNYATGLADENGNVDPNWPRLAKEQGVHHVRFPGGTLSDFYHWRDGIGPVKDRPIRDHWTDEGRSKNVFGTPELIRFSRAAGAEPLITVNAGTAGADEAAAWVAYCNQPGHPERAADGLPEPAGIRLWEVGNELYLPGNPRDKKIITVAPEVYAQRFLEFAAAMRKVDPSIALLAIGSTNSTTVQLPYPKWNDVLLSQAAGEMDYLAIHNAYFPMIFGKSGLTEKDVYQSLWAAPEAVARSLDETAALIERHEKSRRIGIAVTEWGALFSFDPHWVDHVKTQGTAVYVARLLQVFLERPRVTLASYFKFADRTFMGWVGYDQKPKVPYYAFQLFTRHFGSRIVRSEVESPSYTIQPVGVAPSFSEVREVTSLASVSADGKTLFVNLVNRSWDTIHQVVVDTGSFRAGAKVKAWMLSSPGVTDHNGPDLVDFPKDLYREPAVHPKAPSHIRIEPSELRNGERLLLPPYSVVTLEFQSET